MQSVRNISRIWLALTVGVGLSFWSMACGKSAQGDDSLITRIQNADRILLATPDKTVTVAGGETFRVKINRVLRGSGKPDNIALITQSGDMTLRTKFTGEKQYLLLLKKTDDAKGWQTSGVEQFPVEDKTVTVALGGGQAEEISLMDLTKLVADNPPSNERILERKDLTGRWFLVINEGGSDIWMWLVEFSRTAAEKDGKPGAWQAKQLAASPMFKSSTLESSEVQDGKVHLQFKVGEQTFRFDGKFSEGNARGSLQLLGVALSPARLIATERTTLEGYAEPRDSIEQVDLLDAMREDKPEALRKFVQKFPTSPLALEACGALAMQLVNKKAPQAEIEKLAAEYRRLAEPWGAPMEMRCYFDLGIALIRGNHLSGLGLKYLDAAEKEFTSATPANIRAQLVKERGRGLLADGRSAEGVKLLADIHQKSPFDPEVTLLLAQQAETDKRPADALPLYAELTALPMLEAQLAMMARKRGEKDFGQRSPSAALKRLWQAQHGKTDGLEAYLTKVYDERVRGLATKPVAPRKADEGTRVVLCELFTGGACPPCIAADAAVTALEATYAPTELVTVRYHEHVPNPDPLANPTNEARFKSYQLEGTPALVLNGKPRQFGGGLELAPAIYAELRREIDGYMTEKIKPEIKLSAPATKGIINITASAGGLSKFPPNVRLVLVLAESRIESLADNGVRVHEMVARTMPAGVNGVAPDKTTGQLKFELKFDVERFRKELSRYLIAFEGEIGQQFREKPLDLKDLRLVGFLQDQDSGEVLQAAVVPVTGDYASTAPVKGKAPETPKAPEKPAGSSGK